jgi:hypothetical protein
MISFSTDKKEIRRFGAVAFVFFGCLCAAGIWFKKPVPVYLFGALSVFGLTFIAAPLPLRGVYRIWMKAAHFLGTLVTTLILALTYYLVITPAALIKRLAGGRPLPRKPDKQTESYWVTRAEPSQPSERFIKRY